MEAAYDDAGCDAYGVGAASDLMRGRPGGLLCFGMPPSSLGV